MRTNFPATSPASRVLRSLGGMAAPPLAPGAVASVKKELRRSLDAELKARAPDAVAHDSAALCAAIAAAPWFDAAGTVAAFLSMPHEVQTQPVLAAAFAARKAVFVPRVTGGRATDMALLHLDGGDELVTLAHDGWGIPTPGPLYAAGPLAGQPRPVWPSRPPGAPPLSLVLVPGVAFDAAGARLGHGKGYYDAFLKSLLAEAHAAGRSKPLLVGLCFDCQVVDPGLIPMADHDVFMDLVVTPGRTLNSARV